MPFTRVAIPAGTPQMQKASIARAVHAAMVATIAIPEDDFFQLLSEYQPGDFHFDRSFLGHLRSDQMVVVQITLRRGRSDAMKRNLYENITLHLGRAADIRPEDVFIYLVENDFSDWSVGGGRMSMEIQMQAGSNVRAA
ncbi:tautomerase family protein [Frateuria terrea]|uniref:Tautomerase enzyme n=1 Tax=Frateuria terrea TaxID=529704 RepID=A0A1H6UJH8_9GAMM|nr:tautomerase family protein [Frateuria terrea]SEI88325.1 Tautomerase enzyme [Frateuria terrea]SFP37797.1 Tautomerase enzyme [Frateuria terrea]